MGQSVVRSRPARTRRGEPLFLNYSVFPTACGWMAIVGNERTVHQLRLGYGDEESLRDELESQTKSKLLRNTRPLSPVSGARGLRNAESATLVDTEQADWYPELREQLQDYAAGEPVSFTKIRCALPKLTDFQQAVVNYVRRIPFGRVLSYGEVAAAVGYPGAARAVGTVMSSNRIPIIIPCHRVVAAGGKLGGYSAPRGVELKQWLLDLEGKRVPDRLV